MRLDWINAGVGAKATRGRVRTPKKANAKQNIRVDYFARKCFWSAIRPRIAFRESRLFTVLVIRTEALRLDRG